MQAQKYLMMKPNVPRFSTSFSFGAFALALSLSVLFAVHLVLASVTKDLWLDETNGIVSTIISSGYWEMWKGAVGQSANTPLYYFLEKVGLEFWNQQPQKFWDLRLYFRISTIFFWIASCLVVFFYSLRLARKDYLRDAPRWEWTLFAVFTAVFYFTNSMGKYYALEARPYALWIFLSTAHFAYVIESVRFGLSPRHWWIYGLVCVALVLNSNVALAQVFWGLAIYSIFRLFQSGWSGLRREMFKLSAIGLPCLFITQWYSVTAQDSGNLPSPPRAYFGALKDIFTATFHFPESVGKYGILLLSIPFLLVLARVAWKRDQLKWPWLYAMAFLASTPAFYISCYIKHILVAPRHYIALLPAMLWVGIATYAVILKALATRPGLPSTFWPRVRVFAMASFLAFQLGNLGFETLGQWNRIKEMSLYGPTQNPSQCPDKIHYHPNDANQMNEACRARSAQ